MTCPSQRLGSRWAPHHQTVKQGDASSPKDVSAPRNAFGPGSVSDSISRWMLSRLSATSNDSWCNPLPNNCYFACRSEGTRPEMLSVWTSILKKAHSPVAFNRAAKKNKIYRALSCCCIPWCCFLWYAVMRCPFWRTGQPGAFQKLQFLIQSPSERPSQAALVCKLEKKFDQKLAFPWKLLSSPAHKF